MYEVTQEITTGVIPLRDPQCTHKNNPCIRHWTPPPSLGILPTTTKLTFGLSKSLENMSLNPSDEKRELRTDFGLGYANNEFYLPIAGCPSVSQLEPQLTDQLTLKGNRAKLLHIPLWHLLITPARI